MPGASIEWLSQLDLFRHVSAETVAAFASASGSRELAPGEPLFHQGEPGDFLFIVREGSLAALTEAEGRETLLRVLGPGELGGLTSITLDQARSATLRATAQSRVVTVAREDILRLLDAHPDLSRSFLVALSAKVRRKTRRLASLMAPEASDRFRVAFYDTKPYDRDSFTPLLDPDLYATWLTPHLDPRTAELAEGHQAVCAFVNDDLGADTLRRLAELGVRLIALRCAGYNNVDVATAEQLGLVVARVPAYSPHAVAEHALALLLTLNRKIHRAHARVREGNFSLAGLVGRDLHGQTAGVVGLGKIGRCMALILRGLGMEVLGHDLSHDPEFNRRHGIQACELDTLLTRSDVVTLHAPLVADTHHMIDAERLHRMKRGVLLINTSRGGLIDSQALIDALKSGHVGGAGLDVYEEEAEYFFEDRSAQVIEDDALARLLTFNNVIVTSHQAFLTEQALQNIASTTVENIRRFASGAGPVENQVKPSIRP